MNPSPPLSAAFPLTVANGSSHPLGVNVMHIMGSLCTAGWSGLASACSATPGPVRVLDFTGATHCGAVLEDAAAFGRRLARDATASGRPCHVLIAPADLIFGFCRIIQMTLDTAGLTAGVFRSMPSALHWLEQENLLPTSPPPT